MKRSMDTVSPRMVVSLERTFSTFTVESLRVAALGAALEVCFSFAFLFTHELQRSYRSLRSKFAAIFSIRVEPQTPDLRMAWVLARLR